MKPQVALWVALLVAPATAFLQSRSVRGGVDETTSPTAPEPAQSHERAQLHARLNDVRVRVDELARLVSSRASTGARSSADPLGLDIEQHLARHGLRLDSRDAEERSRAAGERRAELLARIDRLLGEADPLAAAAEWSRLSKEGLLDEVLAELQRRAEAQPQNLQASLDLARGAVAAMSAVPYGPRMMSHAEAAEEAFVHALELAPEDGALRTERAQALARWPTFLGRRAEAIADLEDMLLQGGPAPGAQAESYRLLGTLLLEQGELERARAAWELGLGSFPSDESLREQLRLHARR